MAARRVDPERRALTALLVLVVDRDPAPPRLAGETADQHLAILDQAGVGGAWRPVPAVRVADIGVRRDALDRRLRAQVAIASVEPQPVADDRTAIGDAGVVRLDDARRFGDADAAQLIVEVVAARPVACQAGERRPPEGVAARARDDVHDRAAGVGLTEAAAHADRDFLDADRIVDVRRHAAAARRSDRHSAHGHAPFIAGTAVGGEERHRWR